MVSGTNREDDTTRSPAARHCRNRVAPPAGRSTYHLTKRINAVCPPSKLYRCCQALRQHDPRHSLAHPDSAPAGLVPLGSIHTYAATRANHAGAIARHIDHQEYGGYHAPCSGVHAGAPVATDDEFPRSSVGQNLPVRGGVRHGPRLLSEGYHARNSLCAVFGIGGQTSVCRFSCSTDGTCLVLGHRTDHSHYGLHGTPATEHRTIVR